MERAIVTAEGKKRVADLHRLARKERSRMFSHREGRNIGDMTRQRDRRRVKARKERNKQRALEGRKKKKDLPNGNAVRKEEG